MMTSPTVLTCVSVAARFLKKFLILCLHKLLSLQSVAQQLTFEKFLGIMAPSILEVGVIGRVQS